VRQYLEGSDGATVRKWLGGDIPRWKRWLGCRLVRSIRDRENKKLAARVITCSQIKNGGILGELREIERLSRKTIKFQISQQGPVFDGEGYKVAWAELDQPVGFITIFVEFCPGHLVSFPIKHRAMRRALLA